MPQDIPYNKLAPPDIYADEVARLQNQLDAAQDPAVAGREALARIMMTLAMPLSARGVTPSRGPWTPSAQAPRVQREAKQPGDDSIGQHVYEALATRARQPGEAVAKQDSGGHLLPWLLGGLAGWGGWKWAGGDKAVDDFMKDDAEERRRAVEAYYDLPDNEYNLPGSTRPFGTGKPFVPPPMSVPYKP